MIHTVRCPTYDLVGRVAIADHLRVHAGTVDRWRRRYADIPIYQRGHTILANRTELDTWFSTNTPTES